MSTDIAEYEQLSLTQFCGPAHLEEDQGTRLQLQVTDAEACICVSPSQALWLGSQLTKWGTGAGS